MINRIMLFFLCGTLLASNCGVSGSTQDAFDKGVALTREGNLKKAFKAFKYAAHKAPDSARYHFAAAQTAPDQNTAFMYMKYAWEKGLKTKAVYLALLKYSLHVSKEKKLEYALTLFKELPDSIGTPIFRGQLFSELGEPDSAYAIWYNEFRKTRQSTLCPLIAKALLRLHKEEQALIFLYQCKTDKILDADGYSTLAAILTMQFKFKEVDRLFDELTKSNIYNDQLRLEYATYLIFNGRFKEAEPLIRRGAGPGTAQGRALMNMRFYTLQLYSAIANGGREQFDKLLASPPKDTVFKSRTAELYTAIQAFSKNDSTAFASLKKARSKLPPDPVTTLLTARAAIGKKEFKTAAALYEQLPGIVLWSPSVLSERAQALVLTGEDDQALKIISFMHKKHLYSRKSLELFRNLTLKKDLIEKSEAAQKILEQHYSNDIGLKWKGLLLAIKSEKIDSALTIAHTLSKSYPDDERFALTELTLLLMKQKYREVLKKIQGSTLPNAKLKPIEAAAWKGIGDTAQAIEAYESAIKDRREPLLMMQLAEMYFQMKSYKKATDLYTQLLENTTDSLIQDSLQVAILLNNNAWTIMTAGTSDLSDALTMVKKAHEIAPKNIHILDTYVAILFKAGKYKECISLIESSDVALQQKRLLCHLAKAYEKRRDSNKARRYLEDALKLKEDDQKLSPLLSDTQIKEAITRLSEQK